MKTKEEFPIIAAYIEAEKARVTNIYMTIILCLPMVAGIIYSL